MGFKKKMYFLFFVWMLVGCNSTDKEIIIVPKDYTGYILIMFNQPDGKEEIYEGSKRVYEITQNGILKTQFSTNEGWQEFPEYYHEKISVENKLSSFVEIGKVPIDEVIGFRGSNGSIRKNSVDEDFVEFAMYYVGNKSEIEEAQKEAEKLDIVKLASD